MGVNKINAEDYSVSEFLAPYDDSYTEIELAEGLQNTGLQFLKDAGFIKDFNPNETKYDEKNKMMYFSYISINPIKRIRYSYSGVKFNFSKLKTRIPRKLKKKLKK